MSNRRFPFSGSGSGERLKFYPNMKAIIAEKPSVGMDIARVVGATDKKDGYCTGNGYMVTWALGHLVSLAMPGAYGNPNLKAQHLNNLAIVHTLRANTLAMRISLNHSWSNDGIVRYSSMKDGRINTTFGNIARNRKTSLNAYASWNATRSTRLMLNGEVGYSDMRSREIDARNYGWHGNLNLGWQQNLPWQLKWSSNLEWMSRRYSLQGYDSGMMMISATLARSFLNDKLDVAISGMSGLGHGGKMYWESVSRTKDFTNISRFIEPMQDITIGITYTFGGKSRKYTEKTVSDSFEMGDSRIVKQQTKRRGKL